MYKDIISIFHYVIHSTILFNGVIKSSKNVHNTINNIISMLLLEEFYVIFKILVFQQNIKIEEFKCNY